MSPTLQSQTFKPRIPLSLVIQIALAIFTIGGSLTAAYFTKGADVTKLSNLERSVETNKQEAQKALDERVPRREFDAWRGVYVDAVQKDLNEIKAGVSAINQELLRQAQERKR
jgi:hypothetical protein